MIKLINNMIGSVVFVVIIFGKKKTFKREKQEKAVNF